mgnify:CR=1 FL=1
MYMDQLNEHHKKLWDFLQKLQSYQSDAEVLAHGKEISATISQLSGILSVHLAAEDKYLYPALQKDPAAHIQQLAAKFSREMGTLADVYKAYRDRFMLTSQIEADPALFLKETARVLQALSNRLQKEDKELYPLLKK